MWKSSDSEAQAKGVNFDLVRSNQGPNQTRSSADEAVRVGDFPLRDIRCSNAIEQQKEMEKREKNSHKRKQERESKEKGKTRVDTRILDFIEGIHIYIGE